MWSHPELFQEKPVCCKATLTLVPRKEQNTEFSSSSSMAWRGGGLCDCEPWRPPLPPGVTTQFQIELLGTTYISGKGCVTYLIPTLFFMHWHTSSDVTHSSSHLVRKIFFFFFSFFLVWPENKNPYGWHKMNQKKPQRISMKYTQRKRLIILRYSTWYSVGCWPFLHY